MRTPIRVLAVAALVLARTAWTYSHPFESARDQYQPREDRPRAAQLPSEATDHPPGVRPDHRFNINKKSTNEPTKNEIPELQVGCGDGLIQEGSREKVPEGNKNKATGKIRRTRAAQKQKRSFYPYAGPTYAAVPFQSITVWEPPYYQLNRPYLIPIWGAPGRPTLYFPPQPLPFNPGVPQDNPKRPFTGPTYLPPPPSPTTSAPPRNTTAIIGDRFNTEEPPPVWDAVSPDETTNRPASVIPTRRPRPPGAPPATRPPLIHGGSGQNNNRQVSTRPPSNRQPTRPPAFRPVPQPSPQPRPQPRPPTTTPPSRSPSTCVWAIISCCSTGGEIRYDCFEQLGCPGAFWDNSPCNNDFARAAIATALNYYEQQ